MNQEKQAAKVSVEIFSKTFMASLKWHPMQLRWLINLEYRAVQWSGRTPFWPSSGGDLDALH